MINTETPYSPLADRLRPRHIDDFFGQAHLLGPQKTLRQVILQGQLHSMILWGPPGTGKTTLAKLRAIIYSLDLNLYLHYKWGLRKSVKLQSVHKLHFIFRHHKKLCYLLMRSIVLTKRNKMHYYLL